jgi:ParB family chromosome partitioning protein
MLTEGAVRAVDKRAQFVGVDAYTNAGGVIMRDLFQGDEGGWLQDVGLLDRLVAEQLHDRAEEIRAEGWKWIEVAPDFAYGQTYGLRLRGQQVPLTEEEQAARDALQAEMDRLEETYAEADEVPDEVDQRLAEIETALAAFDDRPVAFDPEEVGRAGNFRQHRRLGRPACRAGLRPAGGRTADRTGGRNRRRARRAAGRGRTG